MKKTKANRRQSTYSLKEESQNNEPVTEEMSTPLDSLVVKIKCLRLTDIDAYRAFMVKIAFLDQIIYNGVVSSMSARDTTTLVKTIASGTMQYDPADYEKMCLFADSPLTVHIVPLNAEKRVSKRVIETERSSQQVAGSARTSILAQSAPAQRPSSIQQTRLSSAAPARIPGPQPSTMRSFTSLSTAEPSSAERRPSSVPESTSTVRRRRDISCCNIDIIQLFTDITEIVITKHMEPLILPPLLQRKSWDNLPKLTLKIKVNVDAANAVHRERFKDSNFMKMTLLGAYNMPIPYNEAFTYTAASLIPTSNATHSTPINFENGFVSPESFSCTACYPSWETLRTNDHGYTVHHEKWSCEGLMEFQNNTQLELAQYINDTTRDHSTVWASFHRALLPKDTEVWLTDHIRQYSWPLQLNVTREEGGFSLAAFVDLFQLLYPGETTIRIAVPFEWLTYDNIVQRCGCHPLLPVLDRMFVVSDRTQIKSAKESTEPPSASTDWACQPTGADENSAFILIEIKLKNPLVQLIIPPFINDSELTSMLKQLEEQHVKRVCTGRGQLDRDWQSTIRTAINAVRRVPHLGVKDPTTFVHQLAESRTRVEILSSFWQEAAIYVNNNFVAEEFLQSDAKFEEMLMMAHGCLVRLAATVLDSGKQTTIDPLLRAARHARHMQDTEHATDLYIQLVSMHPMNANYWRELGSCMKDSNVHSANVCIDKALRLDPRHPLTLISKGCLIMEHDPDAAEPFFLALIGLYPFWFTGHVVAHAYFLKREEFDVADAILENIMKTRDEQLLQEIDVPRVWERELGDWWDPTPLLPGMSMYFDAADLLLRLRAFPLAELCVAQALCESGECAQYYHMVALCCRLSGDVDGALCHLGRAQAKYEGVSYLKTLEGECYVKCNQPEHGMTRLEKAGTCAEPFSILLSMPCRDEARARTILVDLIRRQPCAYAWMALADDWIMRSPQEKDHNSPNILDSSNNRKAAAACAVQALKWDRFSARAWAMLSKLVPIAARRAHYREMATQCGYPWSNNEINRTVRLSSHHLCHRVGTALRECRCCMCGETRRRVSACI